MLLLGFLMDNLLCFLYFFFYKLNENVVLLDDNDFYVD